MVSGSQQGLDLLGKILIDEGSKVSVETPSYLGALEAFSLYGPEFVSIPTDEHGLLPEAVAKVGQGANTAKKNTLRLSFVTVAPELIRAGVAKLGKLIRAKII